MTDEELEATEKRAQAGYGAPAFEVLRMVEKIRGHEKELHDTEWGVRQAVRCVLDLHGAPHKTKEGHSMGEGLRLDALVERLGDERNRAEQDASILRQERDLAQLLLHDEKTRVLELIRKGIQEWEHIEPAVSALNELREKLTAEMGK